MTLTYSGVQGTTYLPIRQERLTQIKQETADDDTLQSLKAVMLNGWPDKDQLPPQLNPYYHMQDELSVQDGLIFRGKHIVIPTSLRADMRKAIHSSHLGIGSCLRRARVCLFWPGMNSEIQEYISTCEQCRKFERNQQKETMRSHDVPTRPWAKVGCDLFAFDNQEYMVTVDYYSNYFEVDKLGTSYTAKKVINKLKSHYS